MTELDVMNCLAMRLQTTVVVVAVVVLVLVVVVAVVVVGAVVTVQTIEDVAKWTVMQTETPVIPSLWDSGMGASASVRAQNYHFSAHRLHC